MKKLTLLALLSLLLFCACGRGPSQPETAPPSQAEPAEAIPAAAEPDAEPSDEIAAPEPARAEPEASAPEKAEGETTLLHPLIRTSRRSYNDEAGATQFISCVWDGVELDGDEAARFPALAQALLDDAEERKTVILVEAEMSRDDAEEFVQTRSELWYGSFALEQTAVVERSDSNVFSYTILDYSFSGGVHGWYSTDGYNYDPETGRRIRVADAFAGTEALARAVCDALQDNYAEDIFYTPDTLLDEVKAMIAGDSLPFVLTYGGARVLFAPDQLAPYAAGALTVELTYAQSPELFNPAYTRPPDSYIVKMGDGPLAVDVDGDGEPEQVSFSPAYETDEYDNTTIRAVQVQVGNLSAGVETYAYEADAYFVRQQERSCVYVISESENEYKTLTVFDLTGGQIRAASGEYGPNLSPAILESDYGEWGGFRCRTATPSAVH